MTSALIYALTLIFVLAAAGGGLGDLDLDLDYSNEYDDVRPHLVYPDEPRLDNQISNAAQQFGQSIRNAWQSMVDSARSYIEELSNLFSDGRRPNDGHAVFSTDDA
ncbi:uncharacterized protein LOC111081865 [Drosophila obscura]|uniref:uncharacterized protein LOC111081865 n=1 Tax=Drosophila obscura TaxID=7282 RepID=UPI000BA0B173|nr:uncharacterized protein LOC111081865 [Drosophila obscura]